MESPGANLTERVSTISFRRPFFLFPVFFGPPSRALVVITWITTVTCSLHDEVGINCEKGTTTENQRARVKYIGYIKRYMLDDCACVCYLAWHDCHSLVEGERHGPSSYIIIISIVVAVVVIVVKVPPHLHCLLLLLYKFLLITGEIPLDLK